MKKGFFLLLTLAVLAPAVLSAQQRLVRLTRYEGERITGVDASSGFDVRLVQSDQTRVVAEISEEFEERLDLSLDGDGVVRVALHALRGIPRMGSPRNAVLRVTVYLPELATLRAAGGVDIETAGVFRSPRTAIDLTGGTDLESLEVDTDELIVNATGGTDANISGRAGRLEARATGGADIEMNLTCVTVRVEATAGSEVELRGAADTAEFKVSAGADLDADDFMVKRMTVEASAAAEASVWATEQLTATAGSAARVRYRGTPPQLSTRSNSAGSIRRVEHDD